MSIYKKDCTIQKEKKTEDFTLQQKKMRIKLWVETGWIPFFKSAMAGTKKCSMILQSTRTIKYFQMAMEINCKGMSSINHRSRSCLQDATITTPDWSC